MMEKDITTNAGEWITNAIKEFVAKSKENSLAMSTDQKAFDTPLIGFSNGSDPLYDEYVSHIGDFYLTPIDLFRKFFPQESTVASKDLTIISWVLPSTHLTRQEQAAMAKQPSERWIKVRYYGELFNESLRRHLVLKLSDAGIQAVAPVLAPFWSRSDSGLYAPCSNWSERHAAYAAGLGTFGLCDGLITPLGKAMRTGSVIAHISITPSKRPYTDHHEYCLFYSHGTCGKCISRCPVKAISESGHDKQKCRQYTEHEMNEYVRKTYGINTYACGLCQAGVPCTDHIPTPDEG
ncbi:MAG: epoxyqueuosine reductase [Proteobacteria bacterium]|nr:epoxyqueuosine reductase [Pseudomonadota bacterium]